MKKHTFLFKTLAAVVLLATSAACSLTEKPDATGLIGEDAKLACLVNIDRVMADQHIESLDAFENITGKWSDETRVCVSAVNDLDCRELLLWQYDSDTLNMVWIPENPAKAEDVVKKRGKIKKFDDLSIAEVGGCYLGLTPDGLIWTLSASSADEAAGYVRNALARAKTPLESWKRDLLKGDKDVEFFYTDSALTCASGVQFDSVKVNLTVGLYDKEGKAYNIVKGTEYRTIGQCGLKTSREADLCGLMGQLNMARMFDNVRELLPEEVLEYWDSQNDEDLKMLDGQSGPNMLFGKVGASFFDFTTWKFLLNYAFPTNDDARRVFDMSIKNVEQLGIPVQRNGDKVAVNIEGMANCVGSLDGDLLTININDAEFDLDEPLPALAEDALAWCHLRINRNLMMLLGGKPNLDELVVDVYLKPENLELEIVLRESRQTILQALLSR
ncbi:MAG: hypothetical protein K2M19_06035 [Muribaculaceae bacterium]|nr:hypothetical protein [Muribaculaceae bacterium]